MHGKNRVRTVVSSVVALLVALPLGASTFGPAVAQAASSASLRITEMNWNGSTVGAGDQWIEFYNPGSSSINLGLEPFTLYKDGTSFLTLDHGTVGAGGYLVVSRLNAANSTLRGFSKHQTDSSLVLDASDQTYRLENVDGAVTDTVKAGLAGSMNASMSRIHPTADGTAASSWYTAATTGRFFDKGVSQYGTPGSANVELAIPTDLVISPSSPAVTPANTPTITGKFVAASGQVLPTEVQAYFERISTGAIKKSAPAVVDSSTGTFSISGTSLGKGLWHVSVRGQDATGNHTDALVTIPGSPQNVYVVNGNTTVYEKPVLDSTYPTLTNADKVTLTGTVPASAKLVVYVNGSKYDEALPAVDRTFTLTDIPLVADSVNKIEVRATYAGNNTSEPVIVQITQDSMAPVLEVAKVQVNVEKTGTADSIQGLAGAASGAVLAEVYADSSATTLLGVTTVESDGSFAKVAIGDNRYQNVYVVLTDQAGNNSLPIAVDVRSALVDPVIPTPTPTTPVYEGVGGPVGPAEPLPSSDVAKNTSSQTAVTAPIPQTTETVTPTPTPTPTATPDDEGEVKSAATDTNRNWTPWIILIVLIALAILATAGYFYWFGAEEEAATGGATVVRRPESEKNAAKPEKKSDNKPNNRPKRW